MLRRINLNINWTARVRHLPLASAILLIFLCVTCFAQGHLTPILGPKMEPTGNGACRYSVGVIDPLKSNQIETTFHIKNEGSKPTAIERVQASCGCTTVLLGSESASRYTLAAGAEVGVKVTVDASQLHAGPVDKFVWLFTQGSSTPAVTLEINAELPRLIEFAPPRIDFGTVKAGADRSAELTVRLDARLAADLPPLVCSDPDVIVTAEPPVDTTAAAGQFVTKQYRCKLSSQAHLGALNGVFTYVAVASGSSAQKRNAQVLASTSASLDGQIEGSFGVSPGTIVFGTVVAGEKASRQVVITAVSPDVLAGLRVLNAGPWLSAKIVPDKDKPNASATGRGSLVVSVLPNIPFGGVQSQVVIVSRSEQRLIVPVLLQVSKK